METEEHKKRASLLKDLLSAPPDAKQARLEFRTLSPDEIEKKALEESAALEEAKRTKTARDERRLERSAYRAIRQPV